VKTLADIAAAFDAATFPERPDIPARASATKDRSSGRRKAATPSQGGESSPAGEGLENPHASTASGADAADFPQGNESDAPEEAETEADKIAACSLLDTSDTDNGKRLIRYFGRDLLVMAQQGRKDGLYLTWKGTHWDLDGGEAGAHLLAQDVGDLIKLEADALAQTPQEEKALAAAKTAQGELNAIDPADESAEAAGRKAELALALLAGKAARAALAARRKDRRKHGLSTKNKARLENMLGCAAPRLRRPPDAFNVDALLIATKTHTVRLIRELDPENPDEAGERWRARIEAVAEHRREDMLTSVIPVAYDPQARGAKWIKFLDRVLPQPDKRRMVQAFTGIGVTGLPVQRVMFHTGGGANGKSVYLEVVTRLLGDSIAVGLPVESVTGIAMGTGSQASPDIARLFGKRLLRVHELPAGALLRAEVIKKLTGGERLVARELNKGFFEFTPIAKAHMSGNDFPQFDGSDGGMRRRLVVAQWTETIPEGEQRDFQEFVTELLTEGPAILNWLIEGATDFLANGLVVDEGDRAVTLSYFNEMNPVGQFATACLRPEDGQAEKARDVYNAYVNWSLANAKKPMSEARFGRTLKKTHPRDDTGRVHMYVNVRLHDVPDPPPERGASHSPHHQEVAF
jgi:putative DNA primase/helicase